MRRQSCWAFGLCARIFVTAMVFVLLVGAAMAAGPATSTPNVADARRQFQLFPLAFEPNQGQADAQTKFVARGAGYSVLLLGGETVLNVGGRNVSDQIRLRFVGADNSAAVTGQDKLPTIVNYMIGNDRSRWHTNISTYGKVAYQQIYPGIDIVFYGNQGQLEHDFVISPNANPKQIELAISGARKAAIDKNGNLVLYTSQGELRLLRPSAYQMVHGVKREVAAKFRLHDGRVQFQIAKYEHSEPLVIDPVLNWSTYLYHTAGTDASSVQGIAVDASGNAFIAGNTTATAAFDSATLNTLQGNGTAGNTSGGGTGGGDIFIARINNSAGGSTLAWLTFLGSNKLDTVGAQTNSNGTPVAIDGTNVYVVGQTSDPNGGSGFPVSSSAFQAASAVSSATTAGFVVAVPESTGSSLAYGSYLGENQSNCDTAAMAVAVSGGKIYIAGFFSGVKNLSSGNSLLTTSAGYEQSVANVNGLTGGFVEELDPTKSGSAGQVFGTYLVGTSANDNVTLNAIGVGTTGNVYVAGNAKGSSIPAASTKPASTCVSNTQSISSTQAYVVKLDMTASGCSQLLPVGSTHNTYVTVFGGGTTKVNAMVVDGSSPANAYMTGSTTSTTLVSGISGATTPSGLSTTLRDSSCAGCGDAFVAKLDSTGAFTNGWIGYLGGADIDSGNGIAIDNFGKVAVVGTTKSSQAVTNKFPLSNALFSTFGGTQSAFVSIINATPALVFSSYYGGSGTDNGDAVALLPTPAVTQSQALTSCSVSAGTLTCTTSSAINTAVFVTGANITITGNSNSSLNGTFSLSGVNAGSNQFSASVSGLNGQSGSGGSAGVSALVVYFGGDTTSADLPLNAVSFQQSGTFGTKSAGFVGEIAFANTSVPTMSLSGSTSDVSNIGFDSNISPPINYTFALVPTGTSDYVTFNAPMPTTVTNGGSCASGCLQFGSPTAVLHSDGTTSAGSCTAVNSATGGVTCQLGTVSSAIDIKIPAQATSAATCVPAGCTSATNESVTFTGTASAAEINDTDSKGVVAKVDPVTDLSIAQTIPANQQVGTAFDIVLTASNGGTVSNDAGSVTVTETLPADFIWAATNPTVLTDWTCGAPTGQVAGAGGTISCTYAGNGGVLAKSSSATTIAFHGQFSNTLNLGGHGSKQETSVAAISSTTVADSNSADNSQTTNFNATRAGTVTLTLNSTDPNNANAAISTVNLDQSITYNMVVTAPNTNTVNITGLSVTPNLASIPGFHATAASVTLFTATNTSGALDTSSCDVTATAAGCTNVTIGPNDTFTYSVTGTFQSSDTNSLAATSANTTKSFLPSISADVSTINNPTALAVTLQRSAKLALASSGPSTANLAQTGLKYTFTVSSGPACNGSNASTCSANVATGVVITPKLPTGFVASALSVVSPTGTGTDSSSCTLANLQSTSNACTAAVVGIGGGFEVDITGSFPDDGTVLSLSGTAPLTSTTPADKQYVATNIASTVSAAVVDTTTPATVLSTTVSRSVTLALDVVASAATVNLDQTFTYTAKITNTGLATATNVNLVTNGSNTTPKGILPAGFVPTSAACSKVHLGVPTPFATGCDTSGGASGSTGISGTGVNLAPGDEIDYTITGKFPASGSALTSTQATNATTFTASVVDTAVVDTNGNPPQDQTPTNANVTIQRSANISLTIPAVATAKLYDSTAGTQATYKYQLASSNTSANTATNIAFATNLPTGFVVDSFSVPATTANFDTSTCSATGCTAATLAPNNSFELDVIGHYPDDNTVITSATAKTVVVSNATAPALSAAVTPTPTTTCTACGGTGITTTVQRSATLTLTVATNAPLVTSTPTLNLGDSVTYTITLSNTAGDTATNVNIANTLPAGFVPALVTPVTVTPNGISGSCDMTGGTGCSGAGITLAKGSSIIYTVTGSYPDGTTVFNATTTSVTRHLNSNWTAAIVDTPPVSGVNDTPDTVVQRKAVLSLTVTGSTNTVNLGTSMDYTITLSNAGPDTATNVRLTDVVPASFHVTAAAATLTSATDPSSRCDNTATATGCANALAIGTDSGITIASGGKIVYKITGAYPDGDFTVLGATSTSTTYSVTGNSAASVTPTAPTGQTNAPSTTVQRSADLSLGAVTSLSIAPVSGPVLLSTPISNVGGPDDASNVTVAFTMPTGGYQVNNGSTTFPGGCSKALPTDTLITCSLLGPNKVLAKNAGASYVLAMTPDATAVAANVDHVNVSPATPAQISGAVNDPGPNVNSQGYTFTVQRQSDIALGTVTDNGPTSLNTCTNCGSITYTVPVRNFGPDPASGVAVKLTFPSSGYTIDTSTPTTFPGGCSQAGAIVTCSVDSTVTPGTTYVTVGSANSYTVTMKVDPALTISGGSTSTTFDVGVAITSPYLVDNDNKGGAQNSVTKTSTVARLVNLAITASNASSFSPVGLTDTSNPLKYSVTVNNTGANDSTNSVVTFTMPTSGYKWVADTFSGSCTPQSGTSATFTCALGTVTANGGSATATLSLLPDAAAITTGNQVSIQPLHIVVTSPDVSNTNAANNDYMSGHTLPVVIARRADLQITSVTDNSAVTPVAMVGPLTFTTTILNANTATFGDDASNIVVSHVVPSGYTLVPAGWAAYSTCSQTAQTITCSVPGTLTKGTGGSFSVSVTPGNTAVLSSTNIAAPSTTVTVSSATVYDDGTSGAANTAGNNQVLKTSSVARKSDLQVTSIATNATSLTPVGDAGPVIITAKIRNVATAGFGDDALGVSVTFTLQSTSDNVVANSGFTSCGPKVGTSVTCTFGPLAVAAGDQTVSISIDPQDLSAGGSTTPTTGVLVSSTALVWDDSGSNNGQPGTNNSASVVSTIQSVVHLNVGSVTANPAAGTAVNLGQTVKYTAVLNNATTTGNGALTSPATNATLTVQVPAAYAATASVDPSSSAGWVCDFTPTPVSGITPAVCTFNNAGSPITAGGSSTLVITGTYPDSTALLSTSGGAATQTVSAVVASTTSANSDPFVPQSTTTNLQRFVAISANATSNPAVGTPATLATDVVYTFIVSNAASVSAVATNSARGAFVTLALPSNFVNGAVDPTSSAGWSCGAFTSTSVTCSQSNAISSGGSSTLVIRGQYSDATTGLNATALTNGTGQMTVTATPGSTFSQQAASVPLTVATTKTDIERLVHLTATASSAPAANSGTFAALGTTVTYKLTVSNAATVGAVAANTATGVIVNVALPTDFIGATVTSANWDCGGFVANPAPCAYTGSIAPGGSAATQLVITGQYSNTASVLPGGGGYAPGTGNRAVTAALTTNASLDPTPGSASTSTDIERLVQLTITQSPPSVTPVALSAAESYTARVTNSSAAGINDAAGVVITDSLPSGFVLTSASGTNWSCGGAVSGAVSCTLTGTIAAGATSPDLVITGFYDPTISLAGTGTGTRTNSATVSSTLSADQAGTTKTASVDTVIQRNVNMNVSMTVSPNPIGAGGASSNVATYTITVGNNGANDVSGSSKSVKVDFTVPLPNNFTNITASGSAAASVTCDTTTTPGHVICTYPKQSTTQTVISIAGQFNAATVATTGSATAQATATVSTTDALDSDPNNNNASASIIVVDTPAGTNVQPGLSSNGHPITVTYPTVTQAGITTQAVSVAPPLGFHEPAIDYPTVDYSAALPNYFLIASDAAAPVAYTAPVKVCVAYKTLVGITFTKPERIRFFDSTGRDITSSLDATNVCGLTTSVSPGAFTVREPRNHAPVAKAATQQLFAGKIGTNQFTLDATGSTDADISQVCNGSPTPPAAGTQYCGDTLTYVWSGPPGMNGGTGGTTFTQTVSPKADGTLGVPAQVTGSFPLGVSTVTLTVTDQTGASSTSQVSVTVNSFTLSTTNQSAVISAGQSTSFQVVPQDTNGQPLQFTGNMTLTCNGKKDSDGSSLAANHVNCVVSPNPIGQGQFATALLTTTGPNFSQVRPVKPGSSNRSLALVFALMSPALMGIVLVPGRNKRWKALLLLVLLVACLGLQLGCGGSGVAPAVQSQPVQTASGTYTVTITGTAAGGITSTNTFTLTVK